MAKKWETFTMSSDPEDQDGTPYVLLDFIGDDLDPEPLISLIPLRALRPLKKGDPTGPAGDGKVPRAKTGVCIFSTRDATNSSSLNEHLRLVLDTVEERECEIKRIMAAYSLRWQAVLFNEPPEADPRPLLDASLVQRAAKLGLPLETETGDAVSVAPEGNKPT
jgi:hypothetical protein